MTTLPIIRYNDIDRRETRRKANELVPCDLRKLIGVRYHRSPGKFTSNTAALWVILRHQMIDKPSVRRLGFVLHMSNVSLQRHRAMLGAMGWLNVTGEGVEHWLPVSPLEQGTACTD